MLVIRLQRTGRRNIPAYRLAVAQKSAAVKGKVQEHIGHYLPARNPHVFEFRRERVEYWIGKGAQPSDTVARLLARSGMKGLEKFIKAYTKKKSKTKDADVSHGLPRPSKPEGRSGEPVDAGEARETDDKEVKKSTVQPE